LNPSEKYVSWDDDIPNIWKNKIHVPNHQPAKVLVLEELYQKRLCFVLFAHESLGLNQMLLHTMSRAMKRKSGATSSQIKIWLVVSTPPKNISQLG
jgi:hypothetical protein